MARKRRKAEAKAKVAREMEELAGGNLSDPGAALGTPRMELSENVDLTKASPSCIRCHGTGIRGAQHVQTVEGVERIPIICRCVTRNGGVKLRGAERISAEIAKKNADAATEIASQMDPEIEA